MSYRSDDDAQKRNMFLLKWLYGLKYELPLVDYRLIHIKPNYEFRTPEHFTFNFWSEAECKNVSCRVPFSTLQQLSDGGFDGTLRFRMKKEEPTERSKDQIYDDVVESHLDYLFGGI
jgi:hypothetical protein